LRNFFLDKKIFVTGHTTPLGSWICLALHHLGAEVIGCSVKPPVDTNLFKEADIEESVISYICDFKDLKFLKSIINKHQPSIFIYLSPVEGYTDNYIAEDIYSINFTSLINSLKVFGESEHLKLFVNLIPETKMFLDTTAINESSFDNDYIKSGSNLSSEIFVNGISKSFLSENLNILKRTINIRFYPVVCSGDWSKNNMLYSKIKSSRENIIEQDVLKEESGFVYHVLDMINVFFEILKIKFLDLENTVDNFLIKPDNISLRDSVWLNNIVYRMMNKEDIVDNYNYGARYNDFRSSIISFIKYNEKVFMPILEPELAIKMYIEWERARIRGANMKRTTNSQINQYYMDFNKVL